MYITEIDIEWFPLEVQKAILTKSVTPIKSVTDLCTKISREMLNDAKVGYTKLMERNLGTPPVGALFKIDKPVCANINCCIMADKNKCTTNLSGNIINFPECWEYNLNIKEDSEMYTDLKDISRSIVLSWKENNYVMISL
jgi:hypothetical protein